MAYISFVSEHSVGVFYWAENQPQEDGDCVAVQMYGMNAQWDALNCQDNAVDAFICQKGKLQTLLLGELHKP